jgi:hypothetical protein
VGQELEKVRHGRGLDGARLTHRGDSGRTMMPRKVTTANRH